MSDNEAPKAKSSWTDKERLTYLYALLETSNTKLDFHSTPRPAGRSLIACQRMMERLKLTLKDELEALKAGVPLPENNSNNGGAGKKTPSTTPRKRKTKGDAGADGEATPTKRGRKKKDVVEDKGDDEEGDLGIKAETKDEDVEPELEA
ncbi:hypothetical protein T440DRAFT_546356 [Plenodomus tracheiphilus IPT5]|uniref:Uncharacterized protein n=1 Tax=Plenodomus tracheiphilus IPT5 TaxID=1408161 RepID=A0A6A7BF18_9PLEO|nr:hypothetical protein T440DRAFT_546356 [Plenodomus tracheiphilus IPT5]